MNETPTATSLAPPPPSTELLVSDYQQSPKDVLAVAWIGTHFEAAAFRKGKAVSEPVSHPDCGSSDAFDTYLDEALATLGFKGSKAELIIDGGLLDSIHITVPPISNRLQKNFIREKARRLQTDGAAIVWESHRLAAAKSGQRALLHSITKEAFNELESQFERRGLTLKKVLPFMGSATQPFKDIQTPVDSASIVLAPIGSNYKILAIDNNGDLQFARDLNKENGTDPQRVAVEINRCILFTRQQFGKPVSQIVTVGLQAARFKAVIKTKLNGEIPVKHRRDGKNLWLSQLHLSNSLNLAKESVAQDRQLRMRKLLTGGTCLLAGAALLAYTFHTEVEHKDTLSRIARLETNEQDMRTSVVEAAANESEAQNLTSFLAEAETKARPPIEKALLNFLADHYPSDTWTSELATNWIAEDAAWAVRILLVTEADSDGAQRRKEDLQKALGAPPFSMVFPQNLLARVRNVTSNSSIQDLETISIEGKIYTGGSHAQ
ncbi:hypothetical protein [Pelagicoccus sp. SDUM812002]|uniref:hypothetical protein n=1 Tax=Pelagicoccus sp. SDUM812002 TaxID=3041266 RepID=UPI00280F6B27|nr:hypothetical protein [Pelagicoccus sp. SDUM812002]MDQ8186474.1 hypothetical protein [Pelagicoccus sp. SDUM812002]